MSFDSVVELQAAIARGEVPAPVVLIVGSHPGRELAQRLGRLTARERQVFGALVEGKRNKQIAAELGVSVKTVKVHRARVLEKMAVRSIALLARIAERAGPLPGP